jgi:hypothetical protein
MGLGNSSSASTQPFNQFHHFFPLKVVFYLQPKSFSTYFNSSKYFTALQSSIIYSIFYNHHQNNQNNSERTEKVFLLNAVYSHADMQFSYVTNG